jgi:small subunit ribosomal protein S18
MLKIDYKSEEMLRKFLSSYGKIVPRRRSGVCMKHQRKLATAIKRARVVGILPFSTR